VNALPKASVAKPAAARSAPGYSFEMQELWFSLMRRPWKSLALVPAHEGGSTLAVARALATIGGRFRGAPLTLLEGHDLDLESAARLTLAVQTSSTSWAPSAQQERTAVQSDPRTIIALGPVLNNPMAIPVALAAEAVILVLERLVTTRASAERTLQAIGREHVLGAVLLG
jgi:hypothetical protein